MADFADTMKLDLRLDAARVFISAYRKLGEEFEASPRGSARRGVGAGGRVPYLTGKTQGSMHFFGTSVTTAVLRTNVDIQARARGGFNYPAHLNAKTHLGGSRGGGRSAKYLAGLKGFGAAVENVHYQWDEDWWNDGGGGDRFGRVLQSEWDRIG